MPAPKMASILDRPATEIEKPKPLPPGTYLCRVKGMPRYDKSAKKGTEFIEFVLAPQEAYDDVDADDLALLLKPEGQPPKSLSDFVIKATYYLTENSAWRLTKFLEDCGMDLESGTPRQLAEQTQGSEVVATLRHEASQDGQSFFAKLADTAAYTTE